MLAVNRTDILTSGPNYPIATFLDNGTERARFTLGGSLAVGTTTANYGVTIASSTASQLSLSAGAGIAQWAFRNAGGNFYLSTTTVQGTATSSLATLSIDGTSGTTSVWALNVLATGANATSTIEGNLNVKGTLKIGANSVYLSESGIFSNTGSSFDLSGSGQNITVANSSLSVGTTTSFIASLTSASIS